MPISDVFPLRYLSRGLGGLYKAATKEERRKRKAKRRKANRRRLRGEREIRSSLLILDLKDGKL